MEYTSPIQRLVLLFLVSFPLLSDVSSVYAEGKVGIGLGLDISTGEYGGEGKTDMTFVPLNLKYQNDDFALKLTVPYVRIYSEDKNVVGGGSNAVVLNSNNTTTSESKTESGVGDIVFKATYYLYEGDENNALIPEVDLTGKVKFPTADEDKGLGTGEADYAMEGDLTWYTDDYAIFSTLGYKILGSPEDYDLNNVAYGSVGFAYQIKDGFSTGLMYDIKQASTDSGTGMSEATAYVSYKITDNYKFLFYGVKGFSDGSADYGFGLTLTYAMDAGKIAWLAPIKHLSD